MENIGLRIEGASDEALLKRYVEVKDRAAMDELIRRYAPKLRRLLYTLLGPNTELVQDAEQEVFIALLEKAARFEGRSSFSTFFYSLARHRCIDFQRATWRRERKTARGHAPEVSPSPLSGPAEQALASGRREMIQMALRSLTTEEQFMLYMKDAQECTIDELCEITSVRKGTIKSKLSRARRKMAKRLEELGYE